MVDPFSYYSSSSSYPYLPSLVPSLNGAAGAGQRIRRAAANESAEDVLRRYPSLCSDVNDDLPSYPPLFESTQTSAEPSIPCALFWTLHFCLSVNALKGFHRECEDLREALADEVRRHRNTLCSMDSLRSELGGYAWELDMAKHKADAETRRCEDAYEILEETTRRLKQESMLRQRWEKAAMGASRRRKEAVARWRREAEDLRRTEEAVQSFEDQIKEMEEEAEKMLSEERKLRKEAEQRAEAALKRAEEAEAALKRAVMEYSWEELRTATGGFDEANKMGEDKYGTVYKGKCGYNPVCIRVLKRGADLEWEEEAPLMGFRQEVAFLSRIHHPHIVTLLGACSSSDKPCVVYEYIAEGSLEHRLSSSCATPLPWHARFRIFSEIASALSFLHSLPEYVAHGNLKLGNIFLDGNLVCKIGDVGMNRLLRLRGTESSDDDGAMDVRALGIVMLQVLTGLPADGVVGVVDKALEMNELQDILDDSAGEWPMEETTHLAWFSLQFAEQWSSSSSRKLLQVMMEEMEKIRACADEKEVKERILNASSSSDPHGAPHYFVCPISQVFLCLVGNPKSEPGLEKACRLFISEMPASYVRPPSSSSASLTSMAGCCRRSWRIPASLLMVSVTNTNTSKHGSRIMTLRP